MADGRPTAVFVLNVIPQHYGRLTRSWLARLRAFDAAGWATHAVLVNKDPELVARVDGLVKSRRFPAGTALHHYAMRDVRIRPTWGGKLPAGMTADDRVGDWLDWLTGRLPGAVVVADSPAAYPYLAAMSNPVVGRVAAVNLPHLLPGTPPDGPLAERFEERFAEVHDAFDAVVVMTAQQAADLRGRFGADLPVRVIPPSVRVQMPDPVPGPAPLPRRIVSVGPLEPGHDHAAAIRSVAALSVRYPDLRLELVGAGPDADSLRELADSLGVLSRVSILDPALRSTATVLTGARLTLWLGSEDPHPLPIPGSLAAGVPVIARAVRYGAGEMLADPTLGRAISSLDDLTRMMAIELHKSHDPAAVIEAAGPILRRVDPAVVSRQWIGLAAEVADERLDHSRPTVLTESLSSPVRTLRVPVLLADTASSRASWTCELPGLREPAAWLSAPSGADPKAVEPPVTPEQRPAREAFLNVRTTSLAFVAVGRGEPFRLELSDGSTSVPVLATGFEDRIMASRVGNATLSRHPDGTVWISPRDELLLAHFNDGGLLVRTAEDQPPSDVTHAVDWAVDIDWADLVVDEEGVSFHGTLRAHAIAPADDSSPSICVPDVGGYARTIGELAYTGEPVIDGQDWSAPVEGRFHTDPLVATTQLARGALPLFVGFRGLLAPLGGLWTSGTRQRIVLTCPRGEVTLLPSPGGRVLAAPGKGYRARASGVIRSAVGRG